MTASRPIQPVASEQHVTAGPYSPVLRISRDADIIVISGQAPLDLQGQVIGDTIEEQARVTLENCRKQLAAAGASFSDVFKVNVYMTDLADWPRFNNVYREIMPQPFPTRTAIGCALLDGFQVEIEMWAVLA
ncbi:RidA family protein [Sphingopyxis sp. MWB1]|uniref:RidA family protein n=1 Tax=Sphingopyxis sp. MWB1 TaxID=1537715 RepID=UPI00051A775C|nr:RidA family protein [Sphingopyxis sp. MWB1]